MSVGEITRYVRELQVSQPANEDWMVNVEVVLIDHANHTVSQRVSRIELSRLCATKFEAKDKEHEKHREESKAHLTTMRETI